MKNLVLLFTAMILGTPSVFATSTNEDKVATSNAYRNNNSFIFVENGITFSVYPDGEFDFYIEDYVTGSKNGITFNSGYDYSPYAQYDDYGAVIQVENVPIYYDYYGRVSQIGDVNINYRNNRIRSIGGMYVFYDNRGFYNYHTGFINIYNRNYVFRPFHRWFVRPAIGFSLVLNRPYRRYYTPIRYTFHKPYRFNKRRAYVKIGKEHRYNKVRRERANIYRNDKKVAVRSNSYRSNRSVAAKNKGYRSNRAIASNNKTRTNRSATVKRSTTVRRGNNVATANKKRTVVTKRKVTKTPRSTTVKRTTTTYKKPTNKNTGVRSSQGKTQRSVAQTKTKRSITRSVNKAPSTKRSTVSRSSSSRSISKASTNSRKSTSSRSVSARRN
ncbi:hypothetical protein J8L85_13755 [Maribacter sp. MMG018]|uniref:hypothetical protein n=1 Tax=Maribacter sp. MMG018 TaxID=2822688 RepID=UPI001B35A9E2|nr:hypothetical protein [Maribacter sp. MMG018]MBQ4915514.1 hypothetical protein [Maribacter sp. MMG018]